ncbi:MAG: glycosyltransferase family 4 protein [Candidatus Moranbacteria bacterium]|nr:glycosyltransferase family 4 protein [Candidatus Moranbacteria bacterium]
MKILFFNYEYPPLGGGAANATFFLLREYVKIDDLEVDLITSSIDGAYHLEKIGKNVRVHRLPIGKNESNLHFQSQKELIVYAWRAYFFAKKLVKRNKYDATHSFFTVPCGAISWALWWQNKIPYIISLRGSDVPGYSDRFGFIYRTISFFIKHIWNKSAAVVANSKGLKSLAHQTDSKQEIGVIYNGIDIEEFKADNSRKENGKIYLTIGATRVTARKGINYLIEAVDLLKEKFPNIFVEIMGEGDAKDDLENQTKKLGLEKKVKFLGRVPREKTFSYYQKADIFVLPSLNEGMSNAMLEALSSGLPIVSTDTGGADELVKEGVNGYIVKMKDARDLAEKLEKIISNEELRVRMGRESRKIAEKMSWEKVAKQYVNLYRNVG